MADLCKACSIALYGEDGEDFVGQTTQSDWEAGRAAVVICESCGYIQVDPQGNCVSSNCDCQGQPGHGLPWIK